ncbi:MAG: class III signal peptide-containing protein [Candidatus Omnitrophica bacterium]|jgi:uncharacterized protein (UPF0333 family)|nr:class III signal peptide-containing protein [Candidatus Omnitrophota bacterium]
MLLKKGQSTLEYVIILAAVVGAIILASVFVRNNLQTGYNDLTNTVQTRANDITF